jgi:aspartate dehydrogenase
VGHGGALSAEVRRAAGAAVTGHRLGLLGAGALAREVTRALTEGRAPGWTLAAIAARTRPDDPDLAKIWASTPEALLDAEPEVVVEVARPEAVGAWVPPLVEAGVDVIMLSSAALADGALRARLEGSARAPGAGRVSVASGAIAGLDGLRAAAASGRLDRVELTSVKPVVDGSSSGVGRQLLFDGNAGGAVERFPRNLNIAATIALAGLGFERTRVRLWLDASRSCPQHRLVAEGGFGRLEVVCDNTPSEDEPQSSWLAALSAVAALRRRSEPIVVGA